MRIIDSSQSEGSDVSAPCPLPSQAALSPRKNDDGLVSMSRAAFSDETILCTTGVNADSAFGSVIPPLHLSANYAFAGYDQPCAYDYSRSANPTRDLLVPALAHLE